MTIIIITVISHFNELMYQSLSRSTRGLVVKATDWYPANLGSAATEWWQEGHLAKIAFVTQ